MTDYTHGERQRRYREKQKALLERHEDLLSDLTFLLSDIELRKSAESNQDLLTHVETTLRDLIAASRDAVPDLSDSERAALQECEDVLDRHAAARRALRDIRDRRLYRATHATFEDFCRERWGLDADDIAGLYLDEIPSRDAEERP